MKNSPVPTALGTAPTAGAGLIPILLLFLVGAMIAISVNLSKLVADIGAPVFWLLSFALAGAGVLILLLAAFLGQLQGNIWRVLPYSIGAAIFLAVPTVLSFLAVAHVGASFLSLVYAFPVLFTYALAVALGMDRLKGGKVTGVFCGLAGGLILALAKIETLQATGWLAIAASIPVIVALGNIYRTRFWPHSASAVLLSGVTLLMSGLLLGIPASVIEGTEIQQLWQQPAPLILLLLNMSVFAVQFVFYFLLQRLAGPTYLSQIGAVGAALGVAIAVIVFNEPLPQNFTMAMVLIAAGVVLFQIAAIRKNP